MTTTAATTDRPAPAPRPRCRRVTTEPAPPPECPVAARIKILFTLYVNGC